MFHKDCPVTASKEYGQYRETTLSASLSYTLWNTIGNLNILEEKKKNANSHYG